MLCPCCSYQTRQVHSHYTRLLADLPWQGQVVEIRLQARRFRCANPGCLRRIFTERLPTTVRPRARRTIRLGESQLAIGFAVGGEPGSRLSHKLAMPVSGDTLLRMVHSAPFTGFCCSDCRRHRRLGLASWPRIWNDYLRSGAQLRA
ncbi:MULTISPECIES: transposase family protein [unclassified Bradyrhizobium]|uniref:transposase family protein n=1 Tax=Bradyrhizobium sp. USDA 4539 TaxID=2817703 RepID=UPI0020A040A2|nr:transposase family protein [Bradyrhizobium sp. USDA 4539]